MATHYDTLEIKLSATAVEIKHAHRMLVRKYHPDMNCGSNRFVKQFKLVQEAYEVLSDFSKKRSYDNSINNYSASSSSSTSGSSSSTSSDKTSQRTYAKQNTDSNAWSDWVNKANAKREEDKKESEKREREKKEKEKRESESRKTNDYYSRFRTQEKRDGSRTTYTYTTDGDNYYETRSDAESMYNKMYNDNVDDLGDTLSETADMLSNASREIKEAEEARIKTEHDRIKAHREFHNQSEAFQKAKDELDRKREILARQMANESNAKAREENARKKYDKLCSDIKNILNRRNYKTF